MIAAQNLRYQIIPNWEQLPTSFTHRDCVGVDVDSEDNVYLFTRFQPRVIVYNRDGAFLRMTSASTRAATCTSPK